MFKMNDMVPYEQYQRMSEMASQYKQNNNRLRERLDQAKAVLDAPVTKANLTNAIITLESLPDKENLQRFITGNILRGCKSAKTYCKFVKEKCENTGRVYNGFNEKYHTFNHLPYWFVYETFKERALRNPTGSFALRFRDALISYILDFKNKISGRR